MIQYPKRLVFALLIASLFVFSQASNALPQPLGVMSQVELLDHNQASDELVSAPVTQQQDVRQPIEDVPAIASVAVGTGVAMVAVPVVGIAVGIATYFNLRLINVEG